MTKPITKEWLKRVCDNISIRFGDKEHFEFDLKSGNRKLLATQNKSDWDVYISQSYDYGPHQQSSTIFLTTVNDTASLLGLEVLLGGKQRAEVD